MILDLNDITNKMSRVMRKPALYTCENKGADQLRGNHAVDKRLYCYTDSTIPRFPKYKKVKPLTIFLGCTARFEWDFVGNPEDRFCRNAAHR